MACQKSDCLIVVRKPVKAGGAKGAASNRLNRRHQKRSMKYSKFLRIWNYYVKEPHVTTNIWDWKPKNA